MKDIKPATAEQQNGTWWNWRKTTHSETEMETETETQTQTQTQGNNNRSTSITQLGQWAYSYLPYTMTDSITTEATTTTAEAAPADQHADHTLTPAIEATPDPPINNTGWSAYFFSAGKSTEPRKKRSMESLSSPTSDQNTTEQQPPKDSSGETPKPKQDKLRKTSHENLTKQVIPPLTGNPPNQSTKNLSKGQKAPVIPNLVLPTFQDTFYHPPRSFLPKPSMLQQTYELVQSLIFSAPPEFPQKIPADDLPTRRETLQNRRQASDILHHNQHISTRLPKALDLLRVDRLARLRKLRRITIIGIHGWFPGPWLGSVLGKPTGTSTKFTSMMNDALRKYIEQALPDPQGFNPDFTTLIPLEGEGKVDDRVERLFKELTKRTDWVEALHASDAIFLVSHSQGCLVSCKLLERLITTFNLPGDRFLSLAMCGIWNGPYIGLNNNYAIQPVLKLFEGPAAHELFEFQDPHSPASKAVLHSLKNCLKLGVKYVMIGSLNDQVVPLYSAINHPVDHPSILRAIFIDSAVFYSTDFLTNLVVFCLRLRNAGFSDHGLLFLLSDYLVGSLTGVGHSTLYEDPDVFTLALQYFFESSSPLEPPTNVKVAKKRDASSNRNARGEEAEAEAEDKDEGSGRLLPNELTVVDQSLNVKDKPNAFLLTWSLRGLIEDPRIKLMFGPELSFLKASFLHWNPALSTLPPHTSSSSSSSSSPASPSPTSSTAAPAPPQSAHSNSKILRDLKLKLEPFKEVQLTHSHINPFYQALLLPPPYEPFSRFFRWILPFPSRAKL
ncbi:hypothetical protein PCANC_08735 [Puccinia coronata f. sp. avenae]|uniref:YMC020W-like alpha/beta hydrolase domain-containing protein n=1 Tax=Puccinia coronata f. sp. avenae TaxID=200324 RepID=A0A2N5T1X3_9BASI|nr:hypothetical protein PCANC_08735 [Puccinia coronata f. sp. avenae]